MVRGSKSSKSGSRVVSVISDRGTYEINPATERLSVFAPTKMTKTQRTPNTSYAGMRDLDRLRDDEPPSLEELRRWMKNWNENTALQNYEHALSKIKSGDKRWAETLAEIPTVVIAHRLRTSVSAKHSPY